jgi:hypothetical protein
VQCGSVGSDMAQQGVAWLSRLQCGSVGSASACCKAGPGLILGSAPQEVLLLLSKDSMRIQEDGLRQMVKDE